MSPTPVQLVTELNALGIRFVSGGEATVKQGTLPPETLMAGLVQQPEARLRMALIPLLLAYPEYAQDAFKALGRLDSSAAMTFKFYYTAAVFLQQLYRTRLDKLQGITASLPDLFSAELGLIVTKDASPQNHLNALGRRHQVLSDRKVNWSGTYLHAANRFITHRAKEAVWAP